MARIIHFELPAKNPEMLINFYKKVFGWELKQIHEDRNHFSVNTDQEINKIDIKQIPQSEKIKSIVNLISVHSLSNTLALVTESGGELIIEKVNIPNVGNVAYIKDTEGTIIGLVEHTEQ